MKKSLWKFVPIAALAALFANADAQQPPAATTPPTAKSQQTPGTPAKKTSPSTAAKPRTSTPLALKTQKDKASYAFGMSIGKSMHKDSVDIDPNILARGIKDGLAGGKTLLTDDEAKAAVIAFQTELKKKQEAKMEIAGAASKKEGEEFLATNKSAEGVVALPSGLQYKILKQGDGPKPTASDTVVCNYRGTLLNNTEFDSSYKRGQPASFPVNGVIKGWTEALQLMPVGSKWQLFIPAELAYGPRGAGNGDIPPNATLIFEVELISIQGK
jgi:FKBP-type peptidyl-prolyl cis-trans isomerase